jgi:hypothetical protein
VEIHRVADGVWNVAKSICIAKSVSSLARFRRPIPDKPESRNAAQTLVLQRDHSTGCAPSELTFGT